MADKTYMHGAEGEQRHERQKEANLEVADELRAARPEAGVACRGRKRGPTCQSSLARAVHFRMVNWSARTEMGCLK